MCTQKKKKWLSNKIIQTEETTGEMKPKNFLKEYRILNNKLHFL